MEIRTSIRREVHALVADGNGSSLFVIATGWGLLLGTRMIYPVLLPYFRSSFELSLTVAGLLVTILWLGSAVGQLPGGILADRYSERLVMAAGTLIVAIGLIVLVSAPITLVLFVATGLVGLGQSLYPIARITLLSEIYPDRIGSALGVTMATGDLGQTVLPPLAGVLAAAVAWQLGLGVMIPLLLVSGISIWVVLPRRSQTASHSTMGSVSTARRVLTELRQSNMVFMAFMLFLFILVWQSFTGLYPTYLVEVKGFSSSVASVIFSLFFACGVVVKPLAGSAYDRIGIRKALLLVLCGPVVGLGVLPFVDGFWLLVIVTATISTMLGTGAVTQSFIAEAFSEEIRGTGLGVVRTMSATLGAIGPVVFGAVADRGYFNEGYLVLAVVLAIVMVLTLQVSQTNA